MSKGTTIGSAYVQILPSAEGIQGKLTSLLTPELTTAGTTAGKSLTSSLGTALAGAGAVLAASGLVSGIVDFGKKAVEAGKQFDSSMSQVAATMGMTTGEIGELRDFAQEMGATTAFSATEAADALNYMALAGYDAQTSMDMLPTVLNLAAAGGMDLAQASDMITDSQSALGLSLEETSELVDMMAAASSRSNTSVSQLGDAILTIGGTANTLSGGTLELATALGILADNGIKGAEGGTHLRNIILSLSAPTDTAAVALENLGVQTKDADGNLRSLDDIMADLDASLDGLGAAEKAEIISTIFNKTDISSVNALLNTSRERWDELGAAIDDSAGAAERMAETQLDNLAGDVTLLQSAWEGLQIAISDEVTPTLRNLVEWGTEGIGKITEAVGERGLTGAVGALGELLGEAIGGFFANLPSIAVTAVEATMTGLWSMLEGINKGMTLSAFEEDVYAAQDLADAYENVIDLQEQLNTVTSQHMGADIASSYRIALEAAQENLDQLRGSEEARIGILEQIADGTMSYKEAADYLGTSIDNVAHMLVLWKDAEEPAVETTEELAEAADAATSELDELTQALSTAYPAYTKALEGAGVSLEQLADHLTLNGIEAEDWAEAVDGATRGVINSFTELDTSMDMSLEEMAASLERNIADYHSWNENIDTLMKAAQATGDATKVAFVQYMADMGIGAAEQVAMMVEDIDGTLDTFGPLFQQAAAEGIDGVVIGIDYGTPSVTTAANGMLQTAASSASGTAYTKGQEIGYQLGAGVAAGIGNAGYSVQQAAATTVNTAVRQMKNTAQIASPSQVMRFEVGEMLTMGIAEGMTDYFAIGSLKSAAQSAAEAALEAANSELEVKMQTAQWLADLFSGGYNANTDYSALMLQADNLRDFFDLADTRDEKIQAMGIDLEAEGWRTTAELLEDWMEAHGAYIEMSQEQTEELMESVQESQESTVSAILDRLDQLSEQLEDMTATIAAMRLVLDTGALVGEITPALNAAMGAQYGYDERGI